MPLRGLESLHSFYYRQHQPEDWLTPRGLQNQESNRGKNWSQVSDQMGPEAHTICKPLSDGSQQTLYPWRQFELGCVVACNPKHPNRIREDDDESKTYTQLQPWTTHPGLRQGLFFYIWSEKTEAVKEKRGLVKSYFSGKLRPRRRLIINLSTESICKYEGDDQCCLGLSILKSLIFLKLYSIAAVLLSFKSQPQPSGPLLT